MVVTSYAVILFLGLISSILSNKSIAKGLLYLIVEARVDFYFDFKYINYIYLQTIYIFPSISICNKM